MNQCKTCDFFRNWRGDPAEPWMSQCACHRHSPVSQVDILGQREAKSVWPPVGPIDGCGDWIERLANPTPPSE